MGQQQSQPTYPEPSQKPRIPQEPHRSHKHMKQLLGCESTPSNLQALFDGKRAQEAELMNRVLLTTGTANTLPVCQRHREALEDKALAKWNGTPFPPNPDPTFRTSNFLIQTTTALLPHCIQCMHNVGAVNGRLPIPMGVDTCFCASRIVDSDCVYCELTLIEAEYHATANSRKQLDVHGGEFLACECGSRVMMIGDVGELARKCAGCDGLATAPFSNWKAEVVAFRPKGMEVVSINSADEHAKSVAEVSMSRDELERRWQKLLEAANPPVPSQAEAASQPAPAQTEAAVDAEVKLNPSEADILEVSNGKEGNADGVGAHYPTPAPTPAPGFNNILPSTVDIYEKAVSSKTLASNLRQETSNDMKSLTTSKQSLISHAKRTPLAPVSNNAARPRRERVLSAGMRYPKIDIPMFKGLMTNLAFPTVETKKVVAMLEGADVKVFDGKQLLRAIETGLGKEVV